MEKQPITEKHHGRGNEKGGKHYLNIAIETPR